MNRKIKIVLYVVLLTAGCVLAVRFHHAYKAMKAAPVAGLDDAADKEDAATNSPASSTNSMAAVPAGAWTNLVAGTNREAVAAHAAGKTPPAKRPAAKTSDGVGQVFGYGAPLFLVIICLGVLLAREFSEFVAERFTDFIYSAEGEETKDPEYEEAELLLANNQYLEAIRLMREYLKKNPRKIYVSIHIAEIYEKSLGNYLAAALEYEEVLKVRLLPEQWSWTAIHLSNLYSGKMNQTDKAIAWLRRIVAEHGETAAAAKARSRLAQLEGEDPAAAAETPKSDPPPPPPPPPSNLPRGFRPLSSK